MQAILLPDETLYEQAKIIAENPFCPVLFYSVSGDTVTF